MELVGSVAVVTGCTDALGQRVCRAFVESGAQVAGVYVYSNEQGEMPSSDPSDLGTGCITVQADLDDPKQINRMIARVLEAYGRIDILVINSVYKRSVPIKCLDGFTMDIWDQVLIANLASPYLCAKAVAPIMREQNRGRIVIIASIADLAPEGNSIASAVSKEGLIHLTRCMAAALGPEVAVNAVAFDTMRGTRMTANPDPALVEPRIKNPALQESLEWDDVTNQVVLFCRSDSTTGQVLVLGMGAMPRE